MLKLRIACTEDDLLFLYVVRKDPQVSGNLFGATPKDLRTHMEYIKQVQGTSKWIFIAFETQMNRYRIGYSQVYNITDAACELGFVVMPKYWGKGYGTVLVRETLKQVESQFPGKKRILYVKKDNIPAIKSYLKNGFKEVPSDRSDLPNAIKMEL